MVNDKKRCKFLRGGKCNATGTTCEGTRAGGSCPLVSGNGLDREIARHGPPAQRKLDRYGGD